MLKRWMVIALSLVMVFSMMPIGAYAETITFSDMPDDWSTAALQSAVDNGLLNGANGKIMPQENLTRAQMAAVINRAFGAENVAVLADFDDVVASDWFFLDMAKAVAMGTFQGSGNMLNPDDSITREQAFAVIARALNLGTSTVAPVGFSDLSEISTWATGEVYSLVNNGYIQGSNGMLKPQGYITRAEFAQVMHNIINEYVNEAGEYSLNVEGNLMINTPGVTLSSSMITGDLIIGDGVGEGEVVLDDVNVTGRLLVRGGGTDSIVITGDSVIGSITIAKVDGAVRIYAEDGTEIGEVVVDGKDDVMLEGTFTNVTILSNDITVWATNATINTATVAGNDTSVIVGEGSTVEKLVLKGARTKVEVSGTVAQILVEESAEDTVITVDQDGEVEEIIVNSPGTLIEGEGIVKEVLVNADNVAVETEGTKVSAAEGTEGVMAGDEEVEAGESLEVGKVAVVEAPRSGGGSGGSTTPPVDEEATILKVATFAAITVTVGDEVVLPETVEATYDDGTTGSVAVVWDPAVVDTTIVGTIEFTGTIEGTELTAGYTVEVEAAPVITMNHELLDLSNPEFLDDEGYFLNMGFEVNRDLDLTNAYVQFISYYEYKINDEVNNDEVNIVNNSSGDPFARSKEWGFIRYGEDLANPESQPTVLEAGTQYFFAGTGNTNERLYSLSELAAGTEYEVRVVYLIDDDFTWDDFVWDDYLDDSATYTKTYSDWVVYTR